MTYADGAELLSECPDALGLHYEAGLRCAGSNIGWRREGKGEDLSAGGKSSESVFATCDLVDAGAVPSSGLWRAVCDELGRE